MNQREQCPYADSAEHKEFLRDRDAALLSLDEELIRAYAAKYGQAMPLNMEVFWCAVHKARCNLPGLPASARRLSEEWLRSRGYSPNVGGGH